MTSKTCSLLVLINLIHASSSFAQKPAIGQKAPELSSAIWVKPEAERNLTGKAKLLDFWATWCSPCVGEFPKLNELQEKYKDKIEFVSISLEPATKIASFIQKRSLNTIVLSDPNGVVSKNYQIQALPAKFLIDPSGVIAWIGEGSTMLDSVLSRFVSGKPLDQYIVSDDMTEKQKKMVEIMLPHEQVKDARYTFKAFNGSNTFKRKMTVTLPSPSALLILANNVTEIDFLMKYFKNSDLRYKSTTASQKSHIYFETKVLTEDESYWIIASNLAASNKNTLSVIKKKVDGFQLTVANQEKFKSALYDYKSPGKIQIENNNLEFVCYDVKLLEVTLEEHFHRYFNFSIDDKDILLGLTLDVSSVNSLEQGLAQVGIAMHETSFEIEAIDINQN